MARTKKKAINPKPKRSRVSAPKRKRASAGKAIEKSSGPVTPGNVQSQLVILESELFPLLPLRDVVVYPGMVIPLFVGRPKSVSALESAMERDKQLLLVTQKSMDVDEPGADDLYDVATLVQVLQMLKLPDGSIKVLVEGLKRYKLDSILTEGDYFSGVAHSLESEIKPNAKLKALMRHVTDRFEQYVKFNRKVPQETLVAIMNLENPDRLADGIAAHLNTKVPDKQRLLEVTDVTERLSMLSVQLSSEIEVLEIEQKIKGEVRQQIETSQKEYYLNEQLKAIQRELGRDSETAEDVAKYERRIKKAKMSKEAEEKANEELDRLRNMSLISPEATVVRNYLDWLCDLPWAVHTKDRLDVDEAEKILNEDHYGLEKPKERILEFLAVLQLKKDMKGPILCFVGPPGVGKTSLGKSIARALGRKFVRLSLGGVRDEAEIRGHRRTYIGSMPGRIIQSLKKIKSKNPVFLLDEIDKMSVDFRGDPSAALLEVLDPEQNGTFSDHYLEVEFDLSSVMFIATANVSHPIPPALKDRMELIDISSYTEEEKVEIGKRFLVPKQLKGHGLEKYKPTFPESALLTIIRDYTREAGVRNLEREISSVCRKLARQATQKKLTKSSSVTPEAIEEFLGIPRYRRAKHENENGIGLVTGLAVTSVGGERLPVEVSVVNGSGQLILTGKLGDVMQESAKAALSYVRRRAKELGLPADFHKKKDLHIHCPEGAVPKDGPSAGIALTTAIVSALTGKPVRADFAMTGEVTLRGRVLPVGGIKEKLLAAHRTDIKTVLIPIDNEKDLPDLPETVREQMDVLLVDTMDEVLAEAFPGSGLGKKGAIRSSLKKKGAKKKTARKSAVKKRSVKKAASTKKKATRKKGVRKTGAGKSVRKTARKKSVSKKSAKKSAAKKTARKKTLSKTRARRRR